MQTLKNDVRERIISSAQEIFFERGFHKASMRAIAEQSQIVVGNLYNYYKTKDALFEAIINPALRVLSDLIAHHEDGYNGRNLWEIISLQSKKVANALVSYRKSILILIDGTKTSRWEASKHMLYEKMAESSLEHFKSFFYEDSLEKNRIMSNSVTSSFFEGLWQILRESEEDPVSEELLIKYIALYFKGFEEVL